VGVDVEKTSFAFGDKLVELPTKIKDYTTRTLMFYSSSSERISLGCASMPQTSNTISDSVLDVALRVIFITSSFFSTATSTSR